MSKEADKAVTGTTATTAGTAQPTQVAEAAPAAIPAKYVIEADSIDDLMVRAVEVVLKAGEQFKTTKPGPENNAKGVYSTWTLDDGMSVGFPGSEGWGLTPEQAKRLSTGEGCPSILSLRVVLRQFGPFSSIRAKLDERFAATNSREALTLEKLNRARVARGEAPIKG